MVINKEKNIGPFKKSHHGKKIFLTKEGLDKIKKRLDDLTLSRLKAIQRLRLLDRSDKANRLQLANTTYELENSETEIIQLHNVIQKIETPAKKDHPSVVTLGCTVSLQSDQTIQDFTLVSTIEVDPENNKISEECALGKVLMGKKVKDAIVVDTPKGKQLIYSIVAIK